MQEATVLILYFRAIRKSGYVRFCGIKIGRRYQLYNHRPGGFVLYNYWRHGNINAASACAGTAQGMNAGLTCQAKGTKLRFPD